MQGQGMGGMGARTGCVTQCAVEECSYNIEQECHAPAIRVGDAHPSCDTFTTAGIRDAQRDAMPDVSNCKVTDCEYNARMDCGAQGGILVDHHTQHADCATYEPR